jgi:hypothetical protein
VGNYFMKTSDLVHETQPPGRMLDREEADATPTFWADLDDGFRLGFHPPDEGYPFYDAVIMK